MVDSCRPDQLARHFNRPQSCLHLASTHPFTHLPSIPYPTWQPITHPLPLKTSPSFSSTMTRSSSSGSMVRSFPWMLHVAHFLCCVGLVCLSAGCGFADMTDGLSGVHEFFLSVDGVCRGKYMSKQKFLSAAKSGFGFVSVPLSEVLRGRLWKFVTILRGQGRVALGWDSMTRHCKAKNDMGWDGGECWPANRRHFVPGSRRAGRLSLLFKPPLTIFSSLLGSIFNVQSPLAY